jgi:hypothetical protein
MKKTDYNRCNLKKSAENFTIYYDKKSIKRDVFLQFLISYNRN